MKIERFWNKVRKTSGCWNWIGAKDSFGYGHIGDSGKVLKAHRISWRLHTGKPVPKGLLVLHKCDNPACVNPAHLFIGTNKDNMADKVAKGRCWNKGVPPHVPGVKNGQHILTEKDVLEIRKSYTGKYGEMTKLGRKYGVGRSAIYRVVVRDNWKHI